MRHFAMLSASLVLLAAPAAAKDKEPPPPPPVFQAVVDCKTIADPKERLACYDRTVEAMAAASRERELAVYDRTTMREARRGIFGLGLPRLKLFDDDQSEEVTEIDSTIASLRMARDGFHIFVLADGAKWKQTDGRNTFPKAGQKIHIRQAALGSYIANVNDQPGVRVTRIN